MTEPGSGSPAVPLNRSDASILAALTEGSHGGGAVSLKDFLNDYDWLNRALPTFDELSFGFPRLVAARYLTVARDPDGRWALRATSKANALRRSVHAGTLGGVLLAVTAAVDATPYPELEPPENRSLGRLAGFEPDDLRDADRDYRAWFDRTSKPILASARFVARATGIDRRRR